MLLKSLGALVNYSRKPTFAHLLTCPEIASPAHRLNNKWSFYGGWQLPTRSHWRNDTSRVYPILKFWSDLSLVWVWRQSINKSVDSSQPRQRESVGHSMCTNKPSTLYAAVWDEMAGWYARVNASDEF